MSDGSMSEQHKAGQEPLVLPDWLSRAMVVPFIVFGIAVIVVCLMDYLLLRGVSYAQAGGLVKLAIWLGWLVLLVLVGVVKVVWLARGARKVGWSYLELMGKLVSPQYVRVVSAFLAMMIVLVYVLLCAGGARYLPGVLVMVWGVMALELRQAWVWRELEAVGAWLVLAGAIMAVFLAGQVILAVAIALGGGSLAWGFYLLGKYGLSGKTT